MVVPPGVAPGSCPRPGLTRFIRRPLYFELRNQEMVANGGTAPPPSLSKSGRLLLSELANGGSQRACTSSRICGTGSLAGSDGTLVRFTIQMKAGRSGGGCNRIHTVLSRAARSWPTLR